MPENPQQTVILRRCTSCGRQFAGAEGSCPHDGQPLIPLPQDPYLNQTIADKYAVQSLLGVGGMGVIYRARHDLMQRDVAIKMLKAQYATDETSVKRFTREAVAVGRLRHPHVITTYDHGFTNQGQPYLVMDILQGLSLAQIIKTEGQISSRRLVHIFEQVCDALDHAHQKGVLHRDLKPGNIMLINEPDNPDFVKVVDFGVAQLMAVNDQEQQALTQAGEICGSPMYMSPEQCLGKPLDRRGDIYSLGVVMYEALTGKVPLLGGSMVETMSKHIHESPPAMNEVRPDLHIPPRLEQLVFKALSKDPNERQPSMSQLRQELLALAPQGSSKQTLRAVSAQEIPSATKESSPTPWAVLASLLLAVLLLAVVAAACFFFANNQKKIESQTPIHAVRTLLPPVKSVSAPAPQLQAQPKLPEPHSVQTVPPQVKTVPRQTAAKSIKIARSPKPPKAVKKITQRSTAASAPSAASSKPSADPFAALSSHRSYTRRND
ncbi:MAG: serine/threonine protein kinase [Candidatus Obscuribacterales bacterium]|nr:serine/threonine protein kinase [Candidatus Obscuribacterales bacterium]